VHAINKLLDVETAPDWYRPSIVISTIKGEPYEEETWRMRLRFDFGILHNEVDVVVVVAAAAVVVVVVTHAGKRIQDLLFSRYFMISK
jgi:hypothetical protein